MGDNSLLKGTWKLFRSLGNAVTLHEQTSSSSLSDSDSDKSCSRTSREDAEPSSFWQTRQLRKACKSDGLCPQCKAIFSDQSHLKALLSSEGYKHINPRKVHEGKDAGCKLCAALHLQIQDLDRRESEPLRLRVSVGEESKAPLAPSILAYPQDILKIRSLEVSVIDSKTPLRRRKQFYRFHPLANIRLFSIQGNAP